MRHGPIELFLRVDTDETLKRYEAFKVAAREFKPILPDLCGELGLLRQPIGAKIANPGSPVAVKMIEAASLFSDNCFVTPMVAVAGSVADYLVDCVSRKVSAKRIYVNNGGDISVKLAKEETFAVGICSDVATGEITSNATVHASDGIGGIATSGWAGRSHSLGIADAVTVFAGTAAIADTAATLIANAVDLNSSQKVTRAPANDLSPDSDLGGKLVTAHVAQLDEFEKQDALAAGAEFAQELIHSGVVHSAYLSIQGQATVVERDKSLPLEGKPVSNHNHPIEPHGLTHA